MKNHILQVLHAARSARHPGPRPARLRLPHRLSRLHRLLRPQNHAHLGRPVYARGAGRRGRGSRGRLGARDGKAVCVYSSRPRRAEGFVSFVSHRSGPAPNFSSFFPFQLSPEGHQRILFQSPPSGFHSKSNFLVHFSFPFSSHCISFLKPPTLHLPPEGVLSWGFFSRLWVYLQTPPLDLHVSFFN